MTTIREIIFYKNYFHDFYDPLPEKVKVKIDEVLFMISIVERIPAKWFKHMHDMKGLFEIRIEYESNIYRIFCCFDQGNLIVLFNGFQKKSQKTPKNMFDMAKKLMTEYHNKEK